jgi:ribA/ribD-fused uncharacterized protein
MSYIFFYATQSPFSNFYPAKFTKDHIVFFSSEQYMMYQKAKFFGDQEILERILKYQEKTLIADFLSGKINAQQILESQIKTRAWNHDQGEIKKLGRLVKNYDNQAWGSNRVSIVTQGILAKFMQNEDIKEILLKTQNAEIVEASPYDHIWGIGLSAAKAKLTNPKDWPGQNLLGKLLMDVRAQLLHS